MKLYLNEIQPLSSCHENITLLKDPSSSQELHKRLSFLLEVSADLLTLTKEIFRVKLHFISMWKRHMLNHSAYSFLSDLNPKFEMEFIKATSTFLQKSHSEKTRLKLT